MAKMFPSEPGGFCSAGEKLVFNFLRDALDDSHLAWYTPNIIEREPDFILFSPSSGLIILEVKDWTVAQILEMDPKSALLQIGEAQERRKQPLAQAREYMHTLMSLFSKNARRRVNGKPVIPFPIACGAVFPHISRADFVSSGLDRVVPPDKVLLWDEVNPDSPLIRDRSRAAQWIKDNFPPLFPFTATQDDINWAKSLIFPILKVEPPRPPKSLAQQEAILVMDQEQENYARALTGGRLMLSGPAGSGKTLVLASHAAYLPQIHKNVRRILVTFYNLSLMGYIRRMIAKKGASLGAKGVEVIPFFTLCEKILGEKLPHAGEEQEYYQMVIEEAAEKVAQGGDFRNRWDAILVDEGQDFSPKMAQVILNLLPENAPLLVVKDDNQRLYQQDESPWENVPGLVSRVLKSQYRNGRGIAALAWKLLDAAQPESYAARTGRPAHLRGQDMAEMLEKMADEVAALVRSGHPMNEIAILYARANIGGQVNFPQAMREALEERGVLARWAARDTESKYNFDITTDSVTISTIHSAKGLDFASVFLAGLDQLDLDAPQNRRLAHVGITRARENLVICSSRDSDLDKFIAGQI